MERWELAINAYYADEDPKAITQAVDMWRNGTLRNYVWGRAVSDFVAAWVKDNPEPVR